jgi:hypothetical protein
MTKARIVLNMAGFFAAMEVSEDSKHTWRALVRMGIELFILSYSRRVWGRLNSSTDWAIVSALDV